MNSIALPKMHESAPQPSGFLTWQVEIRELYRNYFLVDLILNQSTRLSNESRVNFKYMKLGLMKALERFNNELDEPTTRTGTTQKVVFNKHVSTMKRLNKSVDDLIQQHSFY